MANQIPDHIKAVFAELIALSSQLAIISLYQFHIINMKQKNHIANQR